MAGPMHVGPAILGLCIAMIFDCLRTSRCACTCKPPGQRTLWDMKTREFFLEFVHRILHSALIIAPILSPIILFGLLSCAVRFESTKLGLFPSFRMPFSASTKLCFHQSRRDEHFKHYHLKHQSGSGQSLGTVFRPIQPQWPHF